MISKNIALSLTAMFALVACGGGGSSTTTSSSASAPVPAPAPAPSVTPSTVSTVALTSTNAKVAAAVGLQAAQDTMALSPPLTLLSFNATPSVSNSTQQCSPSGTAIVSGSVASTTSLRYGDTMTTTLNKCALSSTGGSILLSGQATVTVTGGSLASIPFSINLSETLTNFSVNASGLTVSVSGDQSTIWSATSASAQTFVASGNSLKHSYSYGSGAVHNTTWLGYSQTYSLGSPSISSLKATLQSDNTLLGTGLSSMSINTVKNVTVTTGSGGAGSFVLTGANGSQLLVTVNGTAVSIQVDANGDGVFENTVNSTQSEMLSLSTL